MFGFDKKKIDKKEVGEKIRKIRLGERFNFR